MASRSAPAQAGFTLLEVLVAMVLLSMIMTLAFAGLHQAARGWEAQLQSAERVSTRAAVDGLLRRQLQLALPAAFDPRARQADAAVFEGDESRAEWVAPLAVAGGGEGLYKVALQIEQDRGGDRLLFEYALLDPSDRDARLDWQRRELLGGLPALRLDYWGRSGLNSDLDWHSRWEPDTARAPLLLRLAPARRGDDAWREWVAPVAGGAQRS